MLRYIGRRVLLIIITLFLILTINFFLLYLMPGSPFVSAKLTPQQRERLEDKYGLNDPVLVQYTRYMYKVTKLDFGGTIGSNTYEDIYDDYIKERLPLTTKIGLAALLIGTSIGIVLGAVSAINRNSWVDNGLTTLGVVGISIPAFVFAAFLQEIFAIKLDWLPLNYTKATDLVEGYTLAREYKALIMPVIYDIQHAAEVAQHHRVGAAIVDIRAFLVHDGRRDVAVLDRKGAAKAAALAAVLHLGDLDAGLAQQFARLLLHPQLAQAAAGIVVGDLSGAFALPRQLVELDHGLQEVGQLIDARRQPLHARQPDRIVGKQVGIVGFHIAAARAGRNHHVVEILEFLDKLFRQRTRGLAVARTVGRLAATGLRLRDHHLAAGGLQQLER